MKVLASLVLALLCTIPAFGASTSIVANGVLLGAQHVMVSGNLYTVMFIDGSCTQTLSNCDSSRMAFHSLESAQAAGRILLDTILVDGPDGPFRSHPARISGCEGAEAPGFEPQCATLTPYAVDLPNHVFLGCYAIVDGHRGAVWGESITKSIDLNFTAQSTTTFVIWTLEGIAPATATMDFDGNGFSDILMRDPQGVVSIWMMDASGVLSDTVMGAVSTDWKIAGSGDFDGDGKSDILWRSPDGDVIIGLMNGAKVVGSRDIGNVMLSWAIVDIRDYDKDGKSDILWQDSVTGTVAIWYINGLTLASGKALGVANERKIQ